ncbi:MAG: hypothetical protein CML24_11550 [Rhizobiales bacterium]|nr:hypothetical protein [Hyphomicrobiales bacterium]|tara:strand:- start:15174 stop:15617 length:444 start_codon:yes stop_codon:yes gene_type:complete
MGKAWTQAQRDEAADLYRKGYSSSQIAGQVGRTRNSVIGRLTRDGLIGNANRARKTNRRSAMKAERTHTRQPSSPLRANPDSEGVKLLAADVWKPLPGTNPVRLDEVEGCRWPLGEIREGTFCMCNAPKVEGSSYCPTHKRVSEPSR